jgi:hypothetical protein
MPTPRSLTHCLTAVLLFCLCSGAFAQTPDITGSWAVNEKLSDVTDKRVEAALRAAGEKVQGGGWFSSNKERYRGGPVEQELYDRMSYDMVLTIGVDADTYNFTYADDFTRPAYTDNRNRSVSLNALDAVEDFSLGHWEGEVFKVETHPRDGGYAEESYRLINGGKQLQVDLYIMPKSFREAITIKRVYDKK